MSITLNEVELRVLGVLIEKSLSQAGSYPLTINAVLLGANQKQNREPVVEHSEGDVSRALHTLANKNLVKQAAPGMGARSNRFEHNVVERFHWDRREQAVMAELMLRGRQTAGELRTRGSRMTPIPDLPAVHSVLAALANYETPFAEELPREPGRSTTRFRHLLGEGADAREGSSITDQSESPVSSAVSTAPTIQADTSAKTATHSADSDPTPDNLAARVAVLEGKIAPNLKDANDHEGQVMFGHHVVTLIDFLGQKSKLAKWDFMPETEYDKQEFLGAVQDTFGEITRWRDQFKEKFHIWLDSNKPPAWLIDAVPDRGQALREYAETRIDFDHFSDMIVVYSPIVNRYGHANANTIMAHVYTTGTLMLAALCQGSVFRGAIEIGMAGQFDTIGIYGPVLSDVHHLESKIAEYPRIMAGRRLCEYVALHVENLEGAGPARANRAVALLCSRLLGEDLDGDWIVDYMGDGFADLATKKDDWQTLRTNAHAFVQRELKRFKNSGDTKLIERYERLAAYNRSRGLRP